MHLLSKEAYNPAAIEGQQGMKKAITRASKRACTKVSTMMVMADGAGVPGSSPGTAEGAREVPVDSDCDIDCQSASFLPLAKAHSCKLLAHLPLLVLHMVTLSRFCPLILACAMQPFSGDRTDDPIIWLDQFTDLASSLDSDESRAKIFPHQLNQDGPARTWWNDEYVGD
jgi:hypothetical protein